MAPYRTLPIMNEDSWGIWVRRTKKDKNHKKDLTKNLSQLSEYELVNTSSSRTNC